MLKEKVNFFEGNWRKERENYDQKSSTNVKPIDKHGVD